MTYQHREKKIYETGCKNRIASFSYSPFVN